MQHYLGVFVPKHGGRISFTFKCALNEAGTISLFAAWCKTQQGEMYDLYPIYPYNCAVLLDGPTGPSLE